MSAATSGTEIPISDFNKSEMSQLKRKSIRRSASPNENGDRDAPNKRLKVDEVPDTSPGPEGVKDHNGSATNKNGDISMTNASPEQGSLSPDARRPAEAVTTSSSPERNRRPSESRRRETSPYARSPNQDRRSSESRRRDPSPPTARDRGGLEPSRRGSDSRQAAFPDKERNRRRPEVNRDEEKKRGKRLFGGLLSTLSQTTTNSQQKRRQEIEKRQQEKATKQKIEDDKRRTERLAKLDRIRKIEQVRFDEQVMRTRHSNILAMAHSLQTRSEPKLYYRPWEPTPEQEDIIKDQIRDAEAQIEEELQQFRRRKEQRLKDLEALPFSSEVHGTVGETVEKDRSNNAALDESAVTVTNDRKQSPSPAPAPAHKGISHEERDHDEMVEAEEDTVIY